MRRLFVDKQAFRGQSMVELALVLPIFFLLLFGLIDGGRLIIANNTVSQAAREAARRAIVQAPYIGLDGDPGCTAPVCPDAATFRENVRDAANQMTLLIGTIGEAEMTVLCGGIACDASGASTPGNTLSVEITVPIEPILPLWGWFYPDAISATTTMVIP